MHFNLRTILPTAAALLALAAPPPALALAQQDDCSSVVCVLGDGACNRVCEMQGRPGGGRCVPRDGCPAGSEICVCGGGARRTKSKSKTRRGYEVVDGDELFVRALEGVTTVDGFVRAVSEEEKRGAGVGKRSVCCSFPAPVAGLCCEAHCQQIGRLEGGQCSSQNVCVCG